MKKKSTSSKTKTKSKKQQPSKIKLPNRKLQSNHAPSCEDYILIDGNVYQPVTNTERSSFHKYLHQLKHVKSQPVETFHTKPSKINLERYVSTLTRSEKLQMLKKLQHQIGVVKSPINNPVEKLQKRIQKIKMELDFKEDAHTDKIVKLFQSRLISQKQQIDKIKMVRKLKQHKLKTINSTVNLLTKIINAKQQEPQQSYDGLIQSLTSLSSFESITQSKMPNQMEQDALFQQKSNKIEKKQLLNIKQFRQLNIEKEVQFTIKDDIIKQQKQHEVTPGVTDEIKIDNNLTKVQKSQILQNNEDPEEFQCTESSLPKLKIPILMTRDRIQQIQQQKKNKDIEILKQKIDRRVAIQLSCLEQQGQNLFTTLADINNYIVSLYQFASRTHMIQVVGGLNAPYGKSALDKLYALQTIGAIYDEDMNNVLSEEHFLQHFQNLRQQKNIGEYEKIHNRAIFDCFNKGLNAYRPYFQIQGEVYPWVVSQKGITFYQINDENVEEVFEKTKIKVLEDSSTLCGLIPDSKLEINQPLLTAKRDELFNKSIRNKNSTAVNEWQLCVTNYDAMCRLIIAETIFNSELILATDEFLNFNISIDM